MVICSYPLINLSPWPLIISINSLTFMLMFILLISMKKKMIFIMIIFLVMISFLWWRDIIRESTFMGFHSKNNTSNYKLSMILFIVSEIFFFFSFFWAFFHSSLSPNIEIGLMWPPQMIHNFNPFLIPLLNTIILLSSGFSITWAHHSILNKTLIETKISIIITIFLGIYFSFLQYFEYKNAPFSLNDSIFGSSFFLTTGFHGLHVLIGSFFIFINLIRLHFLHFSNSHHFGLEAAIWYWHFVDIIWIFLYTFMYWWIF